MKAILLLGASFTALSSVNAAAQAPGSGAESQATIQSEESSDPAAAQPEQPTEALASSGGLRDIVITAQRRSENLQRAAVAVTAVDGSQVSAAGVTNPNDLSKLVPALQAGTSNGAISAFFIRGVGKFATSSQVDSAVLINLDGVGLARSGSSNGFFFDLERVEVLKGPQGTLYGRNATGGAVNIITRKPSFSKVSGFAEAEIGNYDHFRTTGAVNLPLSDAIAIRAAGQIVRRDGYLTDGTLDEESEAARLSAAFRLGEGVNLLVAGDYFHLGGEGPGAVLLPFTDPDKPLIGALDPRSFSRQTVFVPFAGSVLPPPRTDTFMDAVNWGVYSQLDVETGIGTITFLPAYRETNPRFSASGFQAQDQDEKASQFSAELRLGSNGNGPLKYVLGLYYIDEKTNYELTANQGFNLAYRKVSLPTKSWAPFARLNYSITPELRVDGGIRYTRDKKSISTFGYNVRVICTAPVGGNCIGGPSIPYVAGPPAAIFGPSGALIPNQPFGTTGNRLTASAIDTGGKGTFSATTYHLGLEYDIAPRSLFYVSYDTGFKAGGFFSTIPQDDPTFDPESITAFTVGSKNRFLGNRLQLNLELFHWRYRDQQVSFFSLNSIGGLVSRTANIGRSSMKGVEVDSQFAATDTTLLRANVQYLDAKNEKFEYTVLGAPPNTGCPFGPAPTGGFTINCSGTRPMLASKWTINFGGEQTFWLGDSGKVVLDVGTRYQSRYQSGFELLPIQVQPGYWMTDASITYRTANDRFAVTAFVRNLENNIVIGTSAAVPQTTTYNIGYLRPPRTYGVRAGVKF